MSDLFWLAAALVAMNSAEWIYVVYIIFALVGGSIVIHVTSKRESP